MRTGHSRVGGWDHHGAPVQAVYAGSKVPPVTAAFWIIKVLTTGLGETASDFLVKSFEPALVVPVCGILLAIALATQLARPGFSKCRYWNAVALVAIVGTMVADIVHIALGVPYLVSAIALLTTLIAVMVIWTRSEGRLATDRITRRRTELLYWTTVLVTFALGTAVGDLTATTFGLGYAGSTVLFLLALLIALGVRRWMPVSHGAGFWLAYTLTRPLGASIADWFGAEPLRGGLGLGDGPVSLALILVTFLAIAIVPARFKSVEATTHDRA